TSLGHLGALVIYSWAGEKMPWLMLHLAQPLILLAALMIGRIIESLERSIRAAKDKAGRASQRVIARVLSRGGLARGASAGILVLSAVFVLYQIHSAFNLAYYNGATPVEMAVYVQTSPDVERVMHEIDELSLDLTGGKDMKVMYDSETSWPFEWYLRDYRNRIYQPSGPTAPPSADVPVVLVGLGNSAETEPNLQDYERQPYVLRWWFPEETYRAFVPDQSRVEPPKDYAGWQPLAIWEDRLLGGIAGLGRHVGEQVSAGLGTISTLRDPKEQAKLWRYLIYREPYAPLGSTDFVVYVRKDIIKQYRSVWD
ncbi:MAG: hypothetical protein M1358_17795, partial [Chloroflexi bacterium]|nr:hypothetical protein [Chloroflexota bacterium]